MRVWLAVFLLALAPAPASAQAPPGELIDRTLAIVGGQAVTLGDVRTARALGLVGGDGVDEAAERLIERTLMLREVQRYAPPEPSEAAVAERVAAATARAGGADRLAAILAAGGFTELRLRAWVRDDLRIAAYLDQRFSAAGPASEDLIADWVADLRRRTPVVELYRR